MLPSSYYVPFDQLRKLFLDFLPTDQTPAPTLFLPLPSIHLAYLACLDYHDYLDFFHLLIYLTSPQLPQFRQLSSPSFRAYFLQQRKCTLSWGTSRRAVNTSFGQCRSVSQCGWDLHRAHAKCWSSWFLIHSLRSRFFCLKFDPFQFNFCGLYGTKSFLWQAFE